MTATVAKIIVECLKAEGVKYVFGVSGSDLLPLLDVLYHEPQIKYIQAQHEQNAMYMANGYARASMSPGICLVSSGPGITNCVSGAGQAYFTCAPTILIGADETVKYHGLGISLHHDVETVPIFKPVTKLAVRVEQPDRVAQSVQRAFRVALSGRKGPAYLGIAKDIFNHQAEAEILSPHEYRVEPVPSADPASIARAAELLATAATPVALVGGGLAWGKAEGELLELAGLLAMPVATSRNNKGLIPEDHPLALGTVSRSCAPVSLGFMQNADVLLAVGCTFDEQTTRGFGRRVVPEGVRIIQVDIEPSEIGKIYPVEVGLCGDARSVLRSLLEEVKRTGSNRQPERGRGRVQELMQRKAEWRQSLFLQQTSGKAPIQFLRLFHDLRQALPRDAIVVGASGGTGMWFEYAFEALTHHCGVGGWHPMGAEFPESLGVKLAIPERVVCCVDGDGAMMETVQELATAAAYRIPLLCVVTHNGLYGNMRVTQIERFGSRFIGTDLPIPNLANIANEFGVYGERIEDPDQIIPAVGRALGSGKPALLEVMMDTSPENLVPPGSDTKLGFLHSEAQA